MREEELFSKLLRGPELPPIRQRTAAGSSTSRAATETGFLERPEARRRLVGSGGLCSGRRRTQCRRGSARSELRGRRRVPLVRAGERPAQLSAAALPASPAARGGGAAASGPGSCAAWRRVRRCSRPAQRRLRPPGRGLCLRSCMCVPAARYFSVATTSFPRQDSKVLLESVPNRGRA